MKYSFTDWDERTYRRKTNREITIEANRISDKEVKLLLQDSGKTYIELLFSSKEVVGIICALTAANNDLKCTISTPTILS